ncbi:hypothetical protein WA158_003866 [Blastocystis sp. Blastoise]
MTIIEFRVALPISIEEVDVAYRYMVCKANEDITGGGEGCDWKIHEKFDYSGQNDAKSPRKGYEVKETKGWYEYKEFGITGLLPGFLRTILAGTKLILDEETYTGEHHSQSVNGISIVPHSSFNLNLETKFLRPEERNDNVFSLSEKELKQRQVMDINLFNEKKLHSICDMSTFHSEKKNIGPFQENWIETTPNICYFYRVVKINYIYYNIYHEQIVFTKQICLQMIKYMDKWTDMTENDLELFEEEVRKNLRNLIDDDSKQKMFAHYEE